MSELWKNLAVVSLQVTHYLSIAVWVGVMLFNLIVNFPAMRERAKSPADHAAGMAAQGKRAGPWLYILVALTLASGWAIALTQGGGPAASAGQMAWIKSGLLALMLGLHLWGSFRIWPRIYFAVEDEWPRLFFQYQVTILFSSAFGIAAIALTYLARYFPAI